MKILVTGGTGFLGRHLIGTLCRRGYNLRVLTRTPSDHPWLRDMPRVEVMQGDLQQPNSLKDIALGCQKVVHAAGLFSMWGGAGNFAATNLEGTKSLVAEAIAAKVERFIYVSTVAVIGKPTPHLIIDETHPPQPDDAYQASKLDAEKVVLNAVSHGLPALVLRPGAFYGPLGDYAFNRLFFTDPMRGIIMQMDGGRYIIFPVYIQDVAEAIAHSLEQGRVGEIYNVCGECLSHRDAFTIVKREANLWFPRLNIPKFIGLNFARFLTLVSNITRIEPFYPIGLRSYVFNDWHVSSEKAQRELGFVATPFAEGVRRTLQWYRDGKPATIPEVACEDVQL
jgi:nucleoside-diphosphate-sugar epimerase